MVPLVINGKLELQQSKWDLSQRGNMSGMKLLTKLIHHLARCFPDICENVCGSRSLFNEFMINWAPGRQRAECQLHTWNTWALSGTVGWHWDSHHLCLASVSSGGRREMLPPTRTEPGVQHNQAVVWAGNAKLGHCRNNTVGGTKVFVRPLAEARCPGFQSFPYSVHYLLASISSSWKFFFFSVLIKNRIISLLSS